MKKFTIIFCLLIACLFTSCDPYYVQTINTDSKKSEDVIIHKTKYNVAKELGLGEYYYLDANCNITVLKIKNGYIVFKDDCGSVFIPSEDF